MFEDGFYWIMFNGKLSIAKYEKYNSGGGERPFPWMVMGERVGFETYELHILFKIEEPACV